VSGVFAQFQPVYAAHNIPTFPVKSDKTPAVRNYNKFGLDASSELADRYQDASALGFMCGKRSGITVLDIDSKDERILADALDRHGGTPVLARTGSGHFQAWYRHNGEQRQIRPNRHVPIDVLGGGYVVAPPSHVERGDYQFIEGRLDDLSNLPPLQNRELTEPSRPDRDAWAGMREGAGRNNELFRLVGRAARQADDFKQLLDYAQTQNSQFGEPMPDAEVVKIAKSMWTYQESGRNRFGRPGVHLFSEDAMPLIDDDPDLLRLVMYIKAQNRPGRPFILTNSFCERWGWSRQRLAAARNRGLKRGDFRCISRPAPGRAAFYVWDNPSTVSG
jgi:hypothetical protein